MGHIGNVDSHFDIAVRKRPRMEGIVNILTTNGINTANEKVPEILTVPPSRIIHAFWHFPIVTFFR